MARMLDPSEKVLNSEAMKRKWLAGDSTEEKKINSNRSSNSGCNETKSEMKKTCADCGTSKTPLWRGGPAGPKSLCNACGIRSRKKRRAVIGGGSVSEDKKPKKSGGGGHNRNPRIGDSLKQRLMELGREVMMQRSTVEKQRRKLGEEEQAAVLLMALSYGSVYA